MSRATNSLEINKTFTSVRVIGEADCNVRNPSVHVSGGARVKKCVLVKENATIKGDVIADGNVDIENLDTSNLIADNIVVQTDSVVCGDLNVKGNLITGVINIMGNCIADDSNAMMCASNNIITINSPLTTMDGALNVDVIDEHTPGNGVVVEGLLIKDGEVGPVGVSSNYIYNTIVSNATPFTSQVLRYNGTTNEWGHVDSNTLVSFAGDVQGPSVNNTVVAFGSGRTFSGSVASDNIGIDIGSLSSITSGTKNIAIGRDCLSGLTSGSRNIAVGYYSGQGIVSGSDNIIFNTVRQTTSIGAMHHNIAIGSAALFTTNANSNHNTAIGREACGRILNRRNIAIGWRSMQSTGSGTNCANNVAIGGYSNRRATSGANNNVMIGYGTILFNSGAGVTNNVAIGAEAIRFTSGGGSFNVAVGTAAAERERGNRNVHIGAFTGYVAGSQFHTGANNVIVGTNNNHTSSASNCVAIARNNYFIGSNKFVLGSAASPILPFAAPATPTLPAGVGYVEVTINGTGPHRLPLYL